MKASGKKGGHKVSFDNEGWNILKNKKVNKTIANMQKDSFKMETENLFSNGQNRTLGYNTIANGSEKWAFENNPLKEKLQVSPNVFAMRGTNDIVNLNQTSKSLRGRSKKKMSQQWLNGINDQLNTSTFKEKVIIYWDI